MNAFLHTLIPLVIAVVGSMVWLGLNALVLVYCERKFAGHIQRRPGPFEVGPHGVLQPGTAGAPEPPCA